MGTDNITKVYGHSDDCIEIEGQITEEFYVNGSNGDYLAFSDGTLALIDMDKEGSWRIKVIKSGYYSVVEFDADLDSDVLTIYGNLDWVLHGNNIARS